MLRLIDDTNVAVVSAALPKRPYYSFLASHQAMATLLQTVLPRLHDAFAATALEWYVLSLCSQISEYVGGQLVGSLAEQVALNSRSMVSSERDEAAFLYCASWRDGSYVPAMAQLTRTAKNASYGLACLLVERSYRHGDVATLAAAIDRLSFYAPAIWDTGHPLLEYHVALARYNCLSHKPVELPQLLRVINDHGNKYHKRIFINELCGFLDLPPETIVGLCKSATPRGVFVASHDGIAESLDVAAVESSLLGGI